LSNSLLIEIGLRTREYLQAGPKPAWDTRRGEEFSERGLHFLYCVQ